jgi:hypothetical protein
MTIRKRFLSLSGAAVCCTAALMGQAPTTLFQLDGKADNSNLTCSYGTPCDYWNLINGTGAGPNPGSVGHSLVRTFIDGTATTSAFTGGGSKDFNDIPQWAYSTTSTPNKDTINAGYAAAYTSGGHFELMFGANRASPNGDANIGLWFFQQQVAPGPNGTFTGAHTDHDIFVISAFTQGGGTSGIAVFEWDHTCSAGVKTPAPGQCSDTNLRLLGSQAAGTTCAGSNVCAVTNAGTTNTTWAGALASPLFFAGGVDITAVLGSVSPGASLPCFSSFLEETRSSQSTSAVLKDFVAGGFSVCSVSVKPNCDATATHVIDPPGNSILYALNGTVTNTGVGAIFNVTVNVGFPAGSTSASIASNPAGGGTFTSPGTFVFSSPLAPGASLNYSATYQNTVGSGLVVNIGVAAAASSGGPLVVTSSAILNQCPVPVLPGLTINKSCSVSLQPASGGLVVQVDNVYQVCNTGDTQITAITVSDNKTGGTVATIASLDAASSGSNCTPLTGTGVLTASYRPPACTTDTSGGRCSFNDIATITTGTSALGGGSVQSGQIDSGNRAQLSTSATCHLCAAGACSATTP